MFAGVGIIGALASILASVLVPPPKEDPDPEEASAAGADASTPARDGAGIEAILAQLTELQAEVRALRETMPGNSG
jgi:hypothetical protein